MKNDVVIVPSLTGDLVREAPGFQKKLLCDHKLDILALCGFGCRYCSSNLGNYLRIQKKKFAKLTEEQLGRRTYPADDPSLTFEWRDVIEKLTAELSTKAPSFGAGKTLVFSMLTDGFSPNLVKAGVTRRALELVLAKTSFRIRVLTKNAIVGTRPWIDFFLAHPGRFVVGLSIGTLDDGWARAVEVGASLPSARLRAMSALQAAGVPTFGMLCPVFPDAMSAGRLEELVDRVGPGRVEHLWAEPYNDRANWKKVREGYAPDSDGHRWLTSAFGGDDPSVWSRYATELYTRLRDKARAEGWLDKLRYLLYEGGIVEADAPALRGLEGVLLQSKPGPDGRSQNPHVAALQPPARSRGVRLPHAVPVPARPAPVSDAQRAEIRALLEQEVSVEEVARRVGVRTQQVRGVLAHHTRGTYA